MKAVFVSRYGGPEVLEIRDAPEPAPGPREIQVRVRAIGLNFADIFGRFGVYPGTPKPPFIPGLEFSGDVADIGSDVLHFRRGERVMGYCRLGSHAEFLTVDENYATLIPSEMSYEEGSSFLATSLSAYHGIVRLGNLRSEDKLLIHAAAGGVGLAAVQIAKDIGAEIFATAGSDEKVSLAKSTGAHHVFNYTTTDFAEEVRRHSKDYGVDVVMDSVGGEVFKKSWQLLAQMGRYILFGVSAVTTKGALNRMKAARVFSFMRPIFPPSLMSANKGIFGFNLGTLTGKERYFREAVIELLRLHRKGALKPLIGRVFPFEQIVEAHSFLQSRQSMGKVVIRLDQ
jgi:NADPH:quinone reductase-like Zn-dependent oxidoreductase